MEYSFSYDKPKVIQGLRYHFITRPEIKGLFIVINLFAIVAAVLFYMKKIQPQPFLLSSLLWIILMGVFWFILPYYIYKKAVTFQDHFTAYFLGNSMMLENGKGNMTWEYSRFQNYFESPNFFHLYFNSRSFFLIPKDQMPNTLQSEIRTEFNKHIKNSRTA